MDGSILERPRQGIRRIFIDCTATCRHGMNAGVQRVVRNIVNNAPGVGAEWGLECRGLAFDCLTGFRTVDQIASPSAAQARSPQSGVSLPHRLKAKLKEWIVAAQLLDGYRRAKNALYRAKYRSLFPARMASRAGIRLGRGDVLLLLDGSWDPGLPWGELAAARRRGAVIGLVLHDLIPIRYPGLVARDTQRLFDEWWNKVRPAVDFVIGVSRSVVADIDAVDRSRAAGKTLPPLRNGSFRNGAGLEGAGSGGAPRPEIEAAFVGPTRGPSYLMVGVVALRKNHSLALDAYEQLWAAGADINLVIAGKYGWDAPAMAERIRNHPQLGRRLFWFEDLCDHELDYSYRHAAGLITTSLAEGFNLPIVEALSRGCPVIASDISVHREVGGDFAAFFPADDAAALARLISQHQKQGALPGVQGPAEFRWPDWTESCRELLERVLELAAGELATASSRITLTPIAPSIDEPRNTQPGLRPESINKL